MKPAQSEIDRRRTFAIISHPDAGKTTLTEKLLLYGGAKNLAGTVTAKKNSRDTSSDWMELEKKRGISISSTVLQFEYRGFKLNLLDTPGHRDFSEDTYRVLMAVDSVIMVIDAAKGIESQTVKLFEICRHRGIPVYTFINKLDRPALGPLELLDQIEKVLGMDAYPVCWPLESGPFFKGVYNRLNNTVNLYERVPGGTYKAPVSVHGIDDTVVKEALSDDSYSQIAEELELLDVAHCSLSNDDLWNGKTTPVFFGSAANNFGIELFLNWFLDNSTGPLPRNTKTGSISPDNSNCSAFVFKIMTNMNSRHRDRMVFARICSGIFKREMTLCNTRSGKEVRISNSKTLFGREGETVDEAYPGDVIGFVTNADFHIGDTLSSDSSLSFNEIPRFAPECFAYIRNAQVSHYKSFRKGLDHLLKEDIVQSFYTEHESSPTPLLGAVGELQFEVLQYRLLSEYGVETRLERKDWTLMRWLQPLSADEYSRLHIPFGCSTGKDDKERAVLFFNTAWTMQFFCEKNPDIQLFDTPPETAGVS